MPQPIPPPTLLQENPTVATRRRISKIPLACHTILMNPHDKQITPLQLTKVSELLDNIALSMNRKVRKPTPLRPCSQTIRGHRQNLSPTHQHCNVKTNHICLTHPHGIGVHEELLNKCIITLTNGSGHFFFDKAMGGVLSCPGICGSILHPRAKHRFLL